jgi:hypothetical protein
VRSAKSGKVLKTVKTGGKGKTANIVIREAHKRQLEMIVSSRRGKVAGYRIGVSKVKGHKKR